MIKACQIEWHSSPEDKNTLRRMFGVEDTTSLKGKANWGNFFFANFRESLSPARRHLRNIYICLPKSFLLKTYFGYFIGVWCVRHWISCFKYSKFYLHCNGDVIPSVTISI